MKHRKSEALQLVPKAIQVFREKSCSPNGRLTSERKFFPTMADEQEDQHHSEGSSAPDKEIHDFQDDD